MGKNIEKKVDRIKKTAEFRRYKEVVHQLIGHSADKTYSRHKEELMGGFNEANQEARKRGGLYEEFFVSRTLYGLGIGTMFDEVLKGFIYERIGKENSCKNIIVAKATDKVKGLMEEYVDSHLSSTIRAYAYAILAGISTLSIIKESDGWIANGENWKVYALSIGTVMLGIYVAGRKLYNDLVGKKRILEMAEKEAKLILGKSPSDCS